MKRSAEEPDNTVEKQSRPRTDTDSPDKEEERKTEQELGVPSGTPPVWGSPSLFPMHSDYVKMLHELLCRQKQPSETVAKYYEDKLALCRRCNLSDKASVACIHRGLPKDMQVKATLDQYEGPEQFFNEYLCGRKKKKQRTAPLLPCPKLSDTKSNESHTVKNCPLPSTSNFNHHTPSYVNNGHLGNILQSFTNNSHLGHITPNYTNSGHLEHFTPNCTNNGVTRLKKLPDKEIKLVANYNDMYRKLARVNGVHVKAYIDTEIQQNVLSAEVAQLLELKISPSNVLLIKGIAGDFLVKGEVEILLNVDDIEVTCKVYITNVNMGNVNLLIGRPVIYAEGICLTMINNKATLQQISDIRIVDVQVIPDDYDCVVVLDEDEVIPPGTSVVKVRIPNNFLEHEVCTHARHFELNGEAYSVPATKLKGRQGFMKIINMGTKDLELKKGVLVRADPCNKM